MFAVAAVLLAGCRSDDGSARRRSLEARLAPTDAETVAVTAAHGSPTSAGEAPTSPASSVHEVDGAPRSRADVVALVLRENPTLHAAKAAVRVALSRADIDTALPDPMVRAQVAPLSVVTPFLGGPPFGASVTLAQKIVWPQKLRLAGDTALADAEVAMEEVEAARLRLATTASLLYDDYWTVARTIEVQRDIIDLSRQNEGTAAGGYSAGRGSQQDPLEAEMERIHAEHQLHVQESELIATRARLNALMHRPTSAPLPTPTSPSFLPEETVSSSSSSSPSLREHPSIRMWAARKAAASTKQSLTDWRFLPDVEVNATYNSMWPALPHQLMVGVAFDVPLQLGARDAEVASADAGVLEAEASLMAATDALEAQMAVASSAVEETRRVERLLREQLLPSATDRARAALAGYEEGLHGFDVVMNAERLRYDVRLQLITVTADVSRNHARLLEAQGVFPGLTDEADPLQDPQEPTP